MKKCIFYIYNSLTHAFCFYFQAFMTYDVDHNNGVTKGEFRRVLESFCLPLNTEQFEAVLAKVSTIAPAQIYCFI